MKTKNMVLVTGESKKLKVTGIKKNDKIRWKSSNKKIVSVSKKGKIRANKNGRAVVTGRYKNKKVKCKVTVVSKANANQNKEEITVGTSYYRKFLVDNIYHSGKNGDIHYHVYFPDFYDGKKKMALYITLPGYQGLYFQGVAANLKTEDFGFEAMKYNQDMVILAPQLDDWDGAYEPVVKARTPVYFVIGESDEYYSSKPFKEAYKKLYDLYRKQGLCEKQIDKLLVLDVKNSSYFKGTGVTYQHAASGLFCRDQKIMNWLFEK